MADYVPVPTNPDIYELIRLTHAQPGVDYLFCLPAHVIRAHEEGWEPVPHAPYFLYSNQPCALLFAGEPIPGTDPFLTVPEFFVDPDLVPLEPAAASAAGRSDGAPKTVVPVAPPVAPTTRKA